MNHWTQLTLTRRDQRVVRHGDITAAGSSAGIDMALTLVGLTHGPAVAQAVQLAIQYDPEPRRARAGLLHA